MKKLTEQVKYVVSLMLAFISLISWATLEGQATSPALKNPPSSILSSLPDSSLSKPDPTTQARVVETYGQLSLSFEANQG